MTEERGELTAVEEIRLEKARESAVGAGRGRRTKKGFSLLMRPKVKASRFRRDESPCVEVGNRSHRLHQTREKKVRSA